MGLNLFNGAEAQASGTAVSAGGGNTGGGRDVAFDEAVTGAGMALTFDSGHPMSGLNAYKIALTAAATNITYLGWTSAVIGAPVRRLYGGFSFWGSVIAPSTIRMVEFFNGATVLGWLGVTSGGNNLQFRTSGDAALQNASQASQVSTLYRMEFDIFFDGSGASGRAWWVNGSGVRSNADGWFGSVALGTSAGCDHVRFGATTAAFSTTIGDTFSIDDIWLSDQPRIWTPGRIFVPKLYSTPIQVPKLWTPQLLPAPSYPHTVPPEYITGSPISGGVFLDWLGVEIPWVTPTLPTAPGNNYSIPGGATVVTTQAQLDTALSSGTPQDIKVMNGTYSRATPVSPSAAHRIWCETYNGVTFNYGWQWAYKQNWEMHGGIYNIPDTTHAGSDGITFAIGTWLGGPTNGLGGIVTDVTVDGAGAVEAGIRLACPHQTQVLRCKATNFTDYGIWLSDNNKTSGALITRLEDIEVSGVYRRTTRGASDGLAEAGIWCGHPVLYPSSRIYCHDIGWAGLWTGNNCNDTTFQDLTMLTVFGTVPSTGKTEGAGIYLEHYTRRCTFKRFDLRDVVQGIDHEWDQGIPGNGASIDTVMRYGYIDTSRSSTAAQVGVFLGDGTQRPIIDGVRFLGYTHAGIVDNTAGNNTPTTKNNTTLILGVNSFEGVAGGTYGLTYRHPNDGAATDPLFTTTSGYNVYRGAAPPVALSSPLNGGTPLTDSEYSDTVAGGTYYYAVESVNPYGWRASVQGGPFVVASATAKSLVATVTIVAAMTKITSKKASASVAASALVTKAAQKIMSAPVTATGLVSRSIGKLLSAPVTATASVTMIKSKVVSMVANVAASALFTKTVNKSVQAPVTATATIKKAVSKALSAPVTATAAMTALKVKVQNLVANVSMTAAMTRVANKGLSAPVTATAAITRTVNKILSAPVTATAAITRVISKYLWYPVTVTAARFIKTVSKSVKASMFAIGGMAWVYQPFIGTTFNQGLQAAVTATASMQRLTNKALQSSVGLTASFKRVVSTKMTAAVGATATLIRGLPKTLTATVTVTASMLRGRVLTRPLQATVSIAASIGRKFKHGLVLTPIGQTVLSLIEAVKRSL